PADIETNLDQQMAAFGVSADVIAEALALLEPQGSGGGDTIYPLREGIERFMITDINNAGSGARAQSEIPAFFDQIEIGAGQSHALKYHHAPGGANTLFMDGHV